MIPKNFRAFAVVLAATLLASSLKASDTVLKTKGSSAGSFLHGEGGSFQHLIDDDPPVASHTLNLKAST